MTNDTNNEAIENEIATLESKVPFDSYDVSYIAGRLESLRNQLSGVEAKQDWKS